MFSRRLETALAAGEVRLPDTGRIAIFGADDPTALAGLRKDQLHIVQRRKPAFDRMVSAGFDAAPEASGPYALSFVLAARARRETEARIAMACEVTHGPVVIDGQKTDGIDPILRAVRARANLVSITSKAHGKLGVFEGATFPDWADTPTRIDGFVTRAGVFSAEGPDRGSVLLADALPKELPGRVADIGAGWGYLSEAILRRGGVTALDLVEADHTALACARQNITDPRAAFHWADATAFVPNAPYDVVVTNPPFHSGRKGEPDLGLAFISSAQRALSPRGTLWLVANRHLPYENALSGMFREVAETGGDGGYKVIRAVRPKRPGERGAL